VSKGRAQLEALLRLEDETERKLAVAALIDNVVRLARRFRAIVIGGVAVEFWTRGAYSTADIDLYSTRTAVDERLAELGLHPEGRHWVDPEHDLFNRSPGEFSGTGRGSHPRSGFRQVRRALVLSPEDVLVYRLQEFVGTGHREVASQTISLLTSPDIDEQRLRRRADEERLGPALTELGRLADRVAAGDILASHEASRDRIWPTPELLEYECDANH